jgi:uncharacterized protein YdiU (UPF0061 family)
MKSFGKLQFNNTFSTLGDAFFSQVQPAALADPYLVSANHEALALIGLETDVLMQSEFTRVFAGNEIPAGAEPLSMLYAGHQFGQLVPQLGDGRAILLGDVRTGQGACWELQLKGAGPTPYSRGSDGRAVLRSTIREYLCSEAMHGLGIPSTRALCITGSDDEVYREQIETAAVLVRMAPSHIRFGSFEVFYYRDQYEQLRQLADHLIEHHYPHLQETGEPYLALYREVVLSTARLIAQWQLVGFAHGVMNTDNMSMLGLTLDYGPFGFMDNYDPGFVCNHSDHQGRYAFDQQPSIGQWNLTCLAQAMLPLFDEHDSERAVELAQETLGLYQPELVQQYAQGMRRKIGLEEARQDDHALVTDLLQRMADNGVDYTRMFRALADFGMDEGAGAADEFVDRQAFYQWAEKYRQRLDAEPINQMERSQRMKQVNPKYILRNYLAQRAIEKAGQKDYSEIDHLLKLLHRPFDEQPENENYAALPPDWARHISVSCSS